MKTFKSKIIAGVSALVIAFGVFFAVHAKEKEEKVEVKKVQTQTIWVDTDGSGDNVTGIRASGAPPTGPGSGCYQGNNGEFCARQLQFETPVDPAELIGKTMEEIETDHGPVTSPLSGKLPQNN